MRQYGTPIFTHTHTHERKREILSDTEYMTTSSACRILYFCIYSLRVVWRSSWLSCDMMSGGCAEKHSCISWTHPPAFMVSSIKIWKRNSNNLIVNAVSAVETMHAVVGNIYKRITTKRCRRRRPNTTTQEVDFIFVTLRSIKNSAFRRMYSCVIWTERRVIHFLLCETSK